MTEHFTDGTSDSDDVTNHSYLKQAIEERFGRKIISSGDCIRLSAEIFSSTQSRINPNTLRRFFGLVKAQYAPSRETINILASYAGFESPDDLGKKIIYGQPRGIDDSGQLLTYFTQLFRQSPVKSYSDKTFLTIVRETINFLDQFPALARKFQKAIAKTRNGQDFYFEQFVQVDRLNGPYGEGLLLYMQEKKTAEARIFGHSLLCLRNWLNGDREGVTRQARIVTEHVLTPDIHPFVQGRYFASQLFQADVEHRPVETILDEALVAHQELATDEARDFRFPAFEYNMAQALLLTGYGDQVLYYIDYAFARFPENKINIDPGYYHSLFLYKAVGHAMKGDLKTATTLFRKVKPSQFHFLQKRFETILYLQLQDCLGKSTEASTAHLAELVTATGFTRLSGRNIFLCRNRSRTNS